LFRDLFEDNSTLTGELDLVLTYFLVVSFLNGPGGLLGKKGMLGVNVLESLLVVVLPGEGFKGLDLKEWEFLDKCHIMKSKI
jgi:hypothetical protein